MKNILNRPLVLLDADPSAPTGGGTPPGTENVGVPDFLTEDLSGVDTSLPMIVEGLHDMEVADILLVNNKAGTGQNVKITLKTTAEATKATRGDMVNKGFPLFHNISVTPTPEYDKEAIKRNVAGFVQAMVGKTLFPLDQYKGKVVRVKVVNLKERRDEKSGNTYPPSNSVKAFVKPD